VSHAELVELLYLAIRFQWGARNRVYREVSIRQTPTMIPQAWAPVYYLDVVTMECQRRSGCEPFRTKAWEIKSCRADFLTDTKWPNYIGRADSLCFAAPQGSIHPKELPSGIGLVELMPQGHIQVVKYCSPQEMSDVARYDLMYGLAINGHTSGYLGDNEYEEYSDLRSRYRDGLLPGRADVVVTPDELVASPAWRRQGE